jgi:PII-like signaling protein
LKTEPVTVVRVYLTEGRQVEALTRYLHDQSGVRGITVFRGISGFGPSGHVHSARFIDTAFDLPIVVEFFDEPGRVRAVIEHLGTLVRDHHIVTWPAQVNA